MVEINIRIEKVETYYLIEDISTKKKYIRKDYDSVRNLVDEILRGSLKIGEY